MKLIKIRSIKHPDPAINWDFQAEQAEPKLSEILASGACGNPERSVPASADFDEADVIERFEHEVSSAIAEVVNDAGEIVQEAVPAVTVPMVKLRAEYTIEIEDIADKVAQEKANAEALAYLASTDWMVIREIDAGIPCPASVKAERAAARARIVR